VELSIVEQNAATMLGLVDPVATSTLQDNIRTMSRLSTHWRWSATAYLARAVTAGSGEPVPAPRFACP
jgi:hypothetical protein